MTFGNDKAGRGGQTRWRNTARRTFTTEKDHKSIQKSIEYSL